MTEVSVAWFFRVGLASFLVAEDLQSVGLLFLTSEILLNEFLGTRRVTIIAVNQNVV